MHDVAAGSAQLVKLWIGALLLGRDPGVADQAPLSTLPSAFATIPRLSRLVVWRILQYGPN
jgi:hypothetical protein